MLSVLWRRGVLVPFVGAGMSRDALEGWDGFLLNLVKALAVDLGGPAAMILEKSDAAEKYRIAERAALEAKALSREERASLIRRALRPNGSSDGRIEPPVQMRALAKLHWPLVVTSNYDDFYLAAAADTRRVEICGRGRDDCHRVLRALDENAPPLLWAIQGFVAGQALDESQLVKPSAENPEPRLSVDHLRELIGQLVIGHQQYVQAANAELHFRRAFAEVFRRRSLLFVGSGLQEEYFVSLFAEIVHHHGLGAFPHFALLSEGANVDPWFLQTRLGITVVRYPSYKELPELLTRLDQATDWKHALPHQSQAMPEAITIASSEFGFRVSAKADEHSHLIVRCIWSCLPVPRQSAVGITVDGEATIVSVGRRPDNGPKIGRQADGQLEAAREACLIDQKDFEVGWHAMDTAPAYVFRFSQSPIFAVAARSKDLRATNHDRRDLRVIPEAVCGALRAVDREGYERVMLGPVASGDLNKLHPLHTFAQTLRGVRRFAGGKPQSIREIALYLVDPRVWTLLAAGKLPVAELLCSELLTFRLEVQDHDGHVDSIRLLHTESPTVRELLAQARLRPDHWQIFLSPPPTDQHRTKPEVKVLDIDQTLSATMTVILRPRGV